MAFAATFVALSLPLSSQTIVHDGANRYKPHQSNVQALETTKAKPAVKRATKPVKAKVSPQNKPQVLNSKPSVGNCGDNQYKQFIYQHESGCNTAAVNSIGCKGIGQACPGSKIAHCGNDFACQDKWFSNYAIQRYGSWAAAYNFWVANNWW